MAEVNKQVSNNKKKNEIASIPEEFRPVVEMVNVKKVNKRQVGFYCDPTIITRLDRLLKKKGFKRNRSEVIEGLIKSFVSFMEHNEAK